MTVENGKVELSREGELHARVRVAVYITKSLNSKVISSTHSKHDEEYHATCNNTSQRCRATTRGGRS